MRKHAKPAAPTLTDAVIEPVASEYSEKSISRVRARLTFRCAGRSTGTDECMAMAQVHRMAADLMVLVATSFARGGGGYCMPTVELTSSYRDVVTATIAIELVHGTRAEADLALELLHDAIPAPRA